MAFNSKANRCTLKGFLVTNVEKYENTDYAITFSICVPRPTTVGKKPQYDRFDVYISEKSLVENCKQSLSKGKNVVVKGEMRNWIDGSFKLCASTVQIVW